MAELNLGVEEFITGIDVIFSIFIKLIISPIDITLFFLVGIFRFRLKYLALGVLTIQTSTMVLVLRYSRTINIANGQEPYLSSTAVFLSEVLKLFICLFIVLNDSRFQPKVFCNALNENVFSKPTDTLKMCVPAFLYTVQNNLLYLALSNLDAATYQVR
jgi:UDP-sugar transporter A1/2/3